MKLSIVLLALALGILLVLPQPYASAAPPVPNVNVVNTPAVEVVNTAPIPVVGAVEVSAPQTGEALDVAVTEVPTGVTDALAEISDKLDTLAQEQAVEGRSYQHRCRYPCDLADRAYVDPPESFLVGSITLTAGADKAVALTAWRNDEKVWSAFTLDFGSAPAHFDFSIPFVVDHVEATCEDVVGNCNITLSVVGTPTTAAP